MCIWMLNCLSVYLPVCSLLCSFGGGRWPVRLCVSACLSVCCVFFFGADDGRWELRSHVYLSVVCLSVCMYVCPVCLCNTYTHIIYTYCHNVTHINNVKQTVQAARFWARTLESNSFRLRASRVPPAGPPANHEDQGSKNNTTQQQSNNKTIQVQFNNKPWQGFYAVKAGSSDLYRKMLEHYTQHYKHLTHTH